VEQSSDTLTGSTLAAKSVASDSRHLIWTWCFVAIGRPSRPTILCRYSLETDILIHCLIRHVTWQLKVVTAFCLSGLGQWIEQCFTSPPTQYRLYVRRFLQVKRPNQQYQVLKEQIVHRQIKHTISRH